MSTLVDWQIKGHAIWQGMIKPFNLDQLNPASYDVLLGDQILVEGDGDYDDRRWLPVNIKEDSYRLKPGEFVLAATKEVITLDNNTEAVFCLKSSRGREGLDHMLAAFCDPGFTGQVTLELINCNRFHDFELKGGMRIGQLRFAKLDAAPLKGYRQTGRYNNQSGPTPSRG